MLTDAIGELLPSAFAVALSPIPIIAVVAVLGSARARAAGTAFALGWIAGLVAVSVVVVLLVDLGDDPDTDDPGLGWLQIAIGLLFLALAAKGWRKRPQKGRPAPTPGWLDAIATAGPARAGMVAAALAAANPKNLALTVAAAASIAESGLDGGDAAIAVAVFIAVGSAAVVIPVLAYALTPERAAQPLAAVRDFMTDNNAVIIMIILLLLGATLLGDGLSDLG